MSKIIAVIALLLTAIASTDLSAAGNSSTSSREAAFKAECELLGGRFKRDQQTGTIVCLYDGGFKICDRGARKCENHPDARVTPRLGRTIENSDVSAL